ncbi:molybdopterin dinucleotide-binding protein [Actinomadura craniellae]|uniref:Molybdopterin dinucleotide-binding protein n=1 Tax=Actinomadura craniellae TaxID=2231787 RepID=A0A365H003_9ACTN|nr:molybdopterin-dependent oxidoreductase [Actinomadura craniellae]RAY12412.1 molybdopterin dinucleotide-binding protein [Actinomadura craniellae]
MVEIPLAVHRRTCPLCEAMCGLKIHVRGDEVEKITPDADDVWSKGHICPKGTTLGALHHDPDRLRRPVVKQPDGTFKEVSYAEAYARCDELLAPVIAEHGIEAVTAYVGNPLAHAFDLSRYVGILIGMSGIPMIYSPGVVDQWPKNVGAHLMYGGMWKIPVPDVQRTDLFIAMGANPQASQGSLMACPDVMGEISRIRREGGRVVVVDPRRTGTAAKADEWIPIVPGTDAAFLMAMVHVLFAEGLVELGHVAELVEGGRDAVDALGRLAGPWTPERVAGATGVPADRIRGLARELATTRRAVLYGRIGLCNQEFGTLASWLVDVVNILTGHFDVEGGLMFPLPAAWTVSDLPMPGLEKGAPNFGRWRSRVRGAPEVLGHVPVSCLHEEITTPGEGRIRALFTVAGNPVLSSPEGDRLDAALPRLDAMISLDLWINETTRHADVIFPGFSALESPHFDDMIWMFAVRSGAKFSPPVFEPVEERPGEWEILIRLAGACLGTPMADLDVATIDDGFFDVLAMAHGVDGAAARAHYTEGGPMRLLDLQIRSGPFGDRYGEDPDGLTLDKVRSRPDGIDLGPMRPRLRDVLDTESGRLVLAPPYITADLTRLEGRLDRPRPELVLVNRRHLRSNNSWLHNVPNLVKGTNRCTLLMHPEDAAGRGLADGDLVRVTSQSGSIEIPLEIDDGIMTGVVSTPHGWGHGKDGARLAVAATRPGVNTNTLSPGHLVDVLSGNAMVNGFEVTVTPATPWEPVSERTARPGRTT